MTHTFDSDALDWKCIKRLQGIGSVVLDSWHTPFDHSSDLLKKTNLYAAADCSTWIKNVSQSLYSAYSIDS